MEKNQHPHGPTTRRKAAVTSSNTGHHTATGNYSIFYEIFLKVNHKDCGEF
jgi:hypothetical protein